MNNHRPLPVELLADIFGAIHLKSTYNSPEEWHQSVELLTLSKCAYKFGIQPFRKKKELLLKTISNLNEYLSKMEEMLSRVENWTIERHQEDEPKRRAIAEEHRAQIQEAKCWNSWIFQYHYKVLVWNLRREYQY